MTHYVYTFWAGDRALYVGCTNNLARRGSDHEPMPWSRRADLLSWEAFPNRTEGLAAEAARIVELEPVYNKRGNPAFKRYMKANRYRLVNWPPAGEVA